LDAGADDFMLDSGSIPEIEGRLRVVARHLQAIAQQPGEPAQEQLDLVSLDRRSPEAPPSEPESPAASEEADEADSQEEVFMLVDPTPQPPKQRSGPRRVTSHTSPPDETGYGLHDVLDFAGAVVQALEQLGVPEARPIDVVEAAKDPAFVAWSLVVARRGFDAFWCAVRLEMDRAPAEALYQAVMQQAPRHEDHLLTLQQQVMDLTQDALREAGRASSRLQVFLPQTPIVRLADELPVMLTSTQADRRRFGLALTDEIRLRLTVTTDVSQVQDQTLMQLRPYELLAAPLHTANQVMLLRDGTLLDESYIDKIHALAASRGLEPKVRVFPPPSSIAIFLRRL
jgi:hypothetical protein